VVKAVRRIRVFPYPAFQYAELIFRVYKTDKEFHPATKALLKLKTTTFSNEHKVACCET
jgi:hypothetical protein